MVDNILAENEDFLNPNNDKVNNNTVERQAEGQLEAKINTIGNELKSRNLNASTGARAPSSISTSTLTSSTSTITNDAITIRHRRKVKHRKLSKTQQKMLWRRNRLAEYMSQGYSLPEISTKMQIPYKTLWDDSDILKAQARSNISNLVSDLPHQVELCCLSLNKLMVQLYELQDPNNNS